MIDITGLPLCVFAHAERFELREQLLTHRRNNVPDVWTVPARDQPSVCGYEVHQASKGQLHRIQIDVDIGMIEFNVVDDSEFRQIVHELRTFVEVSSIVFVAFNDEIIAVRHPKADPEVLRHAADQKRWIQSALVHHPGCNTTRSGLTVRAGYDQRTTSANELFFYDFGLGVIEKLEIQSFFNFRITTGNGVANNYTIRGRSEMCRTVALPHSDAQRVEHRRHGRIHILV